MVDAVEESYADMRKRLYDRNKNFSTKDWKITTFKTDKEEEVFRNWVAQQDVPFNHEDPYPDYDMRGFYKALNAGDKRAASAINPSDNQIHYPDYWKTPYHESFSAESQWANDKAPTWQGNDKEGWKLIDSKGVVYKDETIPQQ